MGPKKKLLGYKIDGEWRGIGREAENTSSKRDEGPGKIPSS
jgi:hypothetical protein